MFAEKMSIKRLEIKELCKKKLGEDIPRNFYGKIMKELAYANKNLWIFKSGNGVD